MPQQAAEKLEEAMPRHGRGALIPVDCGKTRRSLHRRGRAALKGPPEPLLINEGL